MRLMLNAAVALTVVALLGACDTARQIEPASQADGCTQCHGFPPAQLSASALPHPSDANCVSCHAATVTADNDLADGGPHFDGRIDLAAHALPYVAGHAAAARAAIASCTACHGPDYGGGAAQSCTACHEAMLGFGDWRTNCSFCHGDRTPGLAGASPAAAPPQTASPGGNQTEANPRVGAHQAHLLAGTFSAPLACESCHAVPGLAFPESLEHLDGRADVEFGTTARQGVAAPGYADGSCAVYCHGATYLLAGGPARSPAWTSSGGIACGACHTLAPESGYHLLHRERGVACGKCHDGLTMDPGLDPTTVNTTTHVNGVFDASPVTTTGTFPAWPGCAACHPTGIP